MYIAKLTDAIHFFSVKIRLDLARQMVQKVFSRKKKIQNVICCSCNCYLNLYHSYSADDKLILFFFFFLENRH